jgi:hypothetical protein
MNPNSAETDNQNADKFNAWLTRRESEIAHSTPDELLWTFMAWNGYNYAPYPYFLTRTDAEFARGNMGSYTTIPGVGSSPIPEISPVYAIRKPWLP